MTAIKAKLTLDNIKNLVNCCGNYLKYRRIFLEFVDTFYIDFKNGLLEETWGDRWHFWVDKAPADGNKYI